MPTVRITLPDAAIDVDYEIRIASGAHAELPDTLRSTCPAHRYVLIADETVGDLYGNALLESLHGHGYVVDLLTFPAGESNKTRETWTDLSDRMLAAGFGRDSAVLALGGGVTGDLAGFVAATYLRGVPFVQLPTTLLAMIDASVGGKTGVDTSAGKNLIGCFLQPRLVVADTDTLATLAPAEVRSGLAEAVKHGAIADPVYFGWLADSVDAILSLQSAALAQLIHRSVEIKASVVTADEREGGLRKILNFGHTIGHAVEALSGFELLHGEAIAIGMVTEAAIGEAMGVTEQGTAARLCQVLQHIGLPTEPPPGMSAADILHQTRTDKKARASQVEYALIDRIGSPGRGTGTYGTPVPDAVVESLIQTG